MAFGFTSINDSGQVIISDEIQTLHFAGKATVTGNDGAAVGDFPSYGGSNDGLDGRILITYTITTNGTPLAFIKPSDYNRWASVITQSVSGTTWTFQVMMSGTSTSDIPELYCFVDANEISVGSDTHGMIVYKSDGSTKTYDSRVHPLAVVDGGTSQPRTLPANGGNPRTTTGHPWNFATLDFNFKSNDGFTSNTLTTSVAHTDLMYAAPSLAQAVYKRQASGFKSSCKRFLFFKRCQDHFSTAVWWVMYRNAFRLQAGQFQSGWGTFAAGFSFRSSFESGGFLGGGGGSSGFGTQPYQPKTINLTSNAFIIADSTGY